MAIQNQAGKLENSTSIDVTEHARTGQKAKAICARQRQKGIPRLTD